MAEEKELTFEEIERQYFINQTIKKSLPRVLAAYIMARPNDSWSYDTEQRTLMAKRVGRMVRIAAQAAFEEET